MAITPLIGKTQLSKYQDLSLHTRPESLEPFILRVQEDYMEELLGEAFYLDLQDKYKDRETTPLTDEYTALMNRVEPFLAYASWLAYLPFSNVKQTESGLRTKLTTESTPVDKDTINLMVSSVKRSVDKYHNKLRAFLTEKATDYPLLPQPEKPPCGTATVQVGGRRTLIL
jgi:hypothetical protein